MSFKNWVQFILVGIIWGATFLWIKVANVELGPLTQVTLRTTISLATLIALYLYRRPKVNWRASLGIFAVLGLFNTALPMSLISWGEQSISSGMASVLHSTMPLWTALISAFLLRNDALNQGGSPLWRAGGLLAGFLGVVVLMSNQFQGAHITVWGALAVLLAAASYGFSNVFARLKTSHLTPEVQTLGQVGMATLYITPAALIFESPFTLPSLPLTWVAVLALGLLNSTVALMLYYSLIHSVGPTRTSLVTYMFPVVGLALGIIFLHEQPDWRLFVGTALILSGIFLFNAKGRG